MKIFFKMDFFLGFLAGGIMALAVLYLTANLYPPTKVQAVFTEQYGFNGRGFGECRVGEFMWEVFTTPLNSYLAIKPIRSPILDRELVVWYEWLEEDSDKQYRLYLLDDDVLFVTIPIGGKQSVALLGDTIRLFERRWKAKIFIAEPRIKTIGVHIARACGTRNSGNTRPGFLFF